MLFLVNYVLMLFAHYLPNDLVSFKRLHLDSGHTITLSPKHMILYGNGKKTKFAEDIQINEVDIIDSIVASINPIEAITFEKVKQEIQKDQEMLQLVEAITKMSDYDSFPDYLSNYSKLKENLSVVDGVPMYGRRLIIPSTLRRSILECLHSAHQCPNKMNDRAKHSVYWPGITTDIENV